MAPHPANRPDPTLTSLDPGAAGGGLWGKSQKAFLGALTSQDHRERGPAGSQITCFSLLHRADSSWDYNVTWNLHLPIRTPEAEFSGGNRPVTAAAKCPPPPAGGGDWYVGDMVGLMA